MAQQLFATTGNPQFKKKKYTDELNARLGLLPNIMEQQSTEKYQKAQIANMAKSQEVAEAQLGIEKERLKQGEAQLGLSRGQFGLEEKAFGLSEKAFGLDESRYALDQKRYTQQETQNQWARKAAKKQQDLTERSEMLGMGVKALGLGTTMFGDKLFKSFGNDATKPMAVDPEMSVDKGASVAMQTPKSFFSDFQVMPTLGGGVLGAGAAQLGGKNKLLKTGLGMGIGGLAGYFGSGGSFSSTLGAGLIGGLGSLL